MKPSSNVGTKGTLWAMIAFYLLIAFEFVYMATPFAAYVYAVYGPSLNFVNEGVFGELISFFLPHIVNETSSPFLDNHNAVGFVLALGGFCAFAIGAIHIYGAKLLKTGAVVGGIYKYIRHPQYASLIICGLGFVLLWPRYATALMFVTMIFAYYFLARIEERECEDKYGESYAEYMKKTGMFFPGHFSPTGNYNISKNIPGGKVVFFLVFYVLSVTLTLSISYGLHQYTLHSLYASYTDDSASISLMKMEKGDIEKLVTIAKNAPNIAPTISALKENPSTRFVNYVMPEGWSITEIPMHQTEGELSDHLLPGKEVLSDLYVVVITEVTITESDDPRGEDILLRNRIRKSLGEVVIRNSTGEIVATRPPVPTVYGDIPVPIY